MISAKDDTLASVGEMKENVEVFFAIRERNMERNGSLKGNKRKLTSRVISESIHAVIY